MIMKATAQAAAYAGNAAGSRGVLMSPEAFELVAEELMIGITHIAAMIVTTPGIISPEITAWGQRLSETFDRWEAESDLSNKEL